MNEPQEFVRVGSLSVNGKVKGSRFWISQIQATRMVLALLVCLVWGTLVARPDPASAGGPTPAKLEIRQIDWSEFPKVSAYVSVQRADGRPYSFLETPDFELREDGVPTGFEETSPLASSITTVLVLDRSSSMVGTPLSDARSAATTYVQQMEEADRTAVIAFGDDVERVIGLTADKVDLENAIIDIESGGQTAFYDAVDAALTELERHSGRTLVIALTDGEDNLSLADDTSVTSTATRLGIPLYVVALGLNAQNSKERQVRDTLETMATNTRGQFAFAPSSDELDRLYSGISKSVKAEFILTYESPNPSYDGRERSLDISFLFENDLELRDTRPFNPGGVIPIPVGTGSTLDVELQVGAAWPTFIWLAAILGALLVGPGLALWGGARASELKFRRLHIRTVEAGSELIGGSCPSEGKTLAFSEGNVIVVCPKCGRTHHADCWHDIFEGKCGACGKGRGRVPPLLLDSIRSKP